MKFKVVSVLLTILFLGILTPMSSMIPQVEAAHSVEVKFRCQEKWGFWFYEYWIKNTAPQGQANITRIAIDKTKGADVAPTILPDGWKFLTDKTWTWFTFYWVDYYPQDKKEDPTGTHKIHPGETKYFKVESERGPKDGTVKTEDDAGNFVTTQRGIDDRYEPPIKNAKIQVPDENKTEPTGGIIAPIDNIPVNKLELLTPYIGLTTLLAVAVMTVGYVKKRKRDTEINS